MSKLVLNHVNTLGCTCTLCSTINNKCVVSCTTKGSACECKSHYFIRHFSKILSDVECKLTLDSFSRIITDQCIDINKPSYKSLTTEFFVLADFSCQLKSGVSTGLINMHGAQVSTICDKITEDAQLITSRAVFNWKYSVRETNDFINMISVSNGVYIPPEFKCPHPPAQLDELDMTLPSLHIWVFTHAPSDAQIIMMAHPSFEGYPHGHLFPRATDIVPSVDYQAVLSQLAVFHQETGLSPLSSLWSFRSHCCRRSTSVFKRPLRDTNPLQIYLAHNEISLQFNRVTNPTYLTGDIPVYFKIGGLAGYSREEIAAALIWLESWTPVMPIIVPVGYPNGHFQHAIHLDVFCSLDEQTRLIICKIVSRYPLYCALIGSETSWVRKVVSFFYLRDYTTLPAYLLSPADCQVSIAILRNVMAVGSVYDMVNRGFSLQNVGTSVCAVSSLAYSMAGKNRSFFDALFCHDMPFIDRLPYGYQCLVWNVSLLLSLTSSVAHVVSINEATVPESTLTDFVDHNLPIITTLMGMSAVASVALSGSKTIIETGRLVSAIRAIYTSSVDISKFSLNLLFSDPVRLPPMCYNLSYVECEKLAPYLLMTTFDLFRDLASEISAKKIAERYSAFDKLYTNLPFVKYIIPMMSSLLNVITDQPIGTLLSVIALVTLFVIYKTRNCCAFPTVEESVASLSKVQAPLETITGVALPGQFVTHNRRLRYNLPCGAYLQLYVYSGVKGFEPATHKKQSPIFFFILPSSRALKEYHPLINMLCLPESIVTVPSDCPNVKMRVNDFSFEGHPRTNTSSQRPKRRTINGVVSSGGIPQRYLDVDNNVTTDYGPTRIKDLNKDWMVGMPATEREPGTDFDFVSGFSWADYEQWADENEIKSSDFHIQCVRAAFLTYGFDKSSLIAHVNAYPLWWQIHCYTCSVYLDTFRPTEALAIISNVNSSLIPIKSGTSKSSSSKKTITKVEKPNQENIVNPAKNNSKIVVIEESVQRDSTPLIMSKAHDTVFPMFNSKDCSNNAFVATAFSTKGVLLTAGHTFPKSTQANFVRIGSNTVEWKRSDTQVIGPDIIRCTNSEINQLIKHSLPPEVCLSEKGKASVIGFYSKTKPQLCISTGLFSGDTHTCSTIPGVSGSPVLDHRNVVVGVHTGGSTNGGPNSFARFTKKILAKLPLDDIKQCMSNIATTIVSPARIVDKQDHGYEHFLSKKHDALVVIGKGDGGQYVSRFSDKPKYCPYFQVFLDKNPKYYDPPVYTRASRSFEAEGNGVAKFSRSFPPFTIDSNWQIAISMLHDAFYPVLSGSVIQDYDTVINSLNKSSAPGVAWKYSTTQDLVDNESEFIHKYIESLKKIGAPASLFKATLKDELRPMQKVVDHKTRLFLIASKEHVIAHSMLCGDQNARMTEYAKMKPSSIAVIGLSPIPLCHHIGKMIPYYDKVMCMDVSGYDSNLNSFMFETIANLRFSCLHPQFQSEETKIMMGNIYRDVYHSPSILPNGSAVYLEHGPSGHACTSYDNTMILYLVLSWVWVVCGGVGTSKIFQQSVKMMLYGDDSIILLNNDIYSFFNPTRISEILATIGWEVEFSDHPEFLGHGIRYNTEWAAPMAVFPRDKLYSSLFYKTTDTIEELYGKVNSLRMEAYSDSISLEMVDDYIMFLLETYPRPLSFALDGDLNYEYFRNPYETLPMSVYMMFQSRSLKTIMQKSAQAKKPPAKQVNKPAQKKVTKVTGPRNDPATSAYTQNLMKQRISKTNKLVSSLKFENALSKRYLNCLVSPSGNRTRIPDCSATPSSIMTTVRYLDVVVPSSGPAAGRFCIMVQPKIGSADAPAHYNVGMVDYSAGVPDDLAVTHAWQEHTSGALAIDPNSVCLTQSAPSFLALMSKQVVAGDLNDRPFINHLPWTGQDIDVRMNFNSTYEEKAGTFTLGGLVRNGSIFIITPGVYEMTLFSVATGVATGNRTLGVAVIEGDVHDDDLGEFKEFYDIGATGVQTQIGILTVTKRDRVFVFWKDELFPPGTNLVDAYMSLAPVAIPSVSYSVDNGLMDLVRPVGLTALFSPTMSALNANGQMISARIPAGNLHNDFLTNATLGRYDSINALSSLPGSCYNSGPFKDGGWTWYLPAVQQDREFKLPSQANNHAYPFLVISGKIDPPAGVLPNTLIMVGKLRTEFTYEFAHSSQTFPVSNTKGSTDIVEAAINAGRDLPAASHNPSHGRVISNAGKAIGDVVDTVESIFSWFF